MQGDGGGKALAAALRASGADILLPFHSDQQRQQLPGVLWECNGRSCVQVTLSCSAGVGHFLNIVL